MNITRRQFCFITFLFLLLPLSVHWRLFLFGGHTKGIVISKNLPFIENHYIQEDIDKYSVIRFEANGRFVEFTGPENIDYPIGKKVTIFYNKRNPEKYVLMTFTGLLLNNKLIFPFALFILWISFYLTVNQSNVKKKANNHR